MPVKKRATKRRLDPVAEAQLWATMFTTGWDFFGDLKDVGIDDTDAARTAAPDAWRRLGRNYLNRDMGADYNCGTLGSWALREFGEPEECQ